LDQIKDGHFKNGISCKYSKESPHVFDFIYQAYQNGVNNFSSNRLFKTFALEDLSHILNMRVNLFTGDESSSLQVFEPLSSDSSSAVFLSKLTKSGGRGGTKFKLLLPKLQIQVPESMLNFLDFKSTYSSFVIMLTKFDLDKCFHLNSIATSVCLNLFLRFLMDCPVYTLANAHDLKFGACVDKSGESFIKFLNEIWGHEHFDLNDILGQIAANNNKRPTEEMPYGENKRERKSSVSTRPTSSLYSRLRYDFAKINIESSSPPKPPVINSYENYYFSFDRHKSSEAANRSLLPCTSPSLTDYRRKSVSSFKPDPVDRQEADKQTSLTTRTRTLTQLNTRQSIGSCLTNMFSLNGRDNCLGRISDR
jgi:hypothetical protein